MNNLESETTLVGSLRRERECTALVVKYLREVEKRRLYLERGFSSLFAYCTDMPTVTREEFELFQKLVGKKAHANFERK